MSESKFELIREFVVITKKICVFKVIIFSKVLLLYINKPKYQF